MKELQEEMPDLDRDYYNDTFVQDLLKYYNEQAEETDRKLKKAARYNMLFIVITTIIFGVLAYFGLCKLSVYVPYIITMSLNFYQCHKIFKEGTR